MKVLNDRQPQGSEMKRRNLTLAVLALSILPMSSQAAQPKLGAPVDGGVFLYREPVEMYWNDWIAFPLMAKTSIPTSGQARATVIGEGKTATFIGNLSINCENGKHYWESAASGSEFLAGEEQAEEIVPKSVARNAVKLLCKKR